jgi:hypothetical protein
MSTLDDAARRLWVWTLVDPFQRDGLRLCGFATRRPTPSPAATRPSLGVTQKVSRCREPLGLVRAAQAVEKHLHGLVDRPLGSLIDHVRQQWCDATSRRRSRLDTPKALAATLPHLSRSSRSIAPRSTGSAGADAASLKPEPLAAQSQQILALANHSPPPRHRKRPSAIQLAAWPRMQSYRPAVEQLAQLMKPRHPRDVALDRRAAVRDIQSLRGDSSVDTSASRAA